MLNKLKQTINDYEPSLVLLSIDDKCRAIFQMFDCDEFSAGKIIFEDVRFLCVGTLEERFQDIEIFTSHNIPQDLQFISTDSLDDYIVVVLHGLLHYEDVSFLPVISNRRIGYVICKSVSYEDNSE
jgi:hypothetical protein